MGDSQDSQDLDKLLLLLDPVDDALLAAAGAPSIGQWRT